MRVGSGVEPSRQHKWAAERCNSRRPVPTGGLAPMSTRNGTADARERLAAAVEQMADSDTFVAWLRARATFRDYSLNNTLLIATQRPDATRVAGYKAWQTLGRQVRKGEHGIKILAPCRIKTEGTD